MNALHPASIPYRSISRSVSAGSLFFFVGVVASPGGGETLLPVVGMVAVGIVLGVAYELAYYRRFRYDLTSDTFDVVSGVVSRRDREVPLRRVQNVDIRQNVLQRALGIAAVHVETAGGGETEVTLQYVAEAEAKRLQRQLRGGAETDADRTDAAGRERSTADEAEVLFEIRPHELALLSVFTIDPGASLLGGIAASFLSGFEPGRLVSMVGIEADLPGTGLVAVAWAVLLFVLAAWVLSAALTVSRYYGFRLTRVGDELRYERGLLQRYSGTIPLDKVQTLTIKESVPFRWLGYGSLAVETAGYAPGQSDGRGTESAIPLADRDRVLELARSIEPFEAGSLERTPPRARERYAVRYVGVLCAIMGLGYVAATYTAIVDDWHAFAALLFVVPAAAHYKWTSRGFRADERYFLARTGFWRRTTKVVPYYRIQSVVTTQTIFQRRRDLASVTADTASSASFFGRAATAIDVDGRTALELQRTLAERLQERLRARNRRRAFDRLFSDADEAGDGSTSADESNAPADPTGSARRGRDATERADGEHVGDRDGTGTDDPGDTAGRTTDSDPGEDADADSEPGDDAS